MISFDQAFTRLLGHEGGYVNDPEDPGGETKFGISKRSYPTVDIKNLTREAAATIYYQDFWAPLGDADSAIKYQVFEFAVNASISTAIRKLQAAVGVADDGHWGKVSKAAMLATDKNDVLMRFAAQKLRFYTSLKKFDRYGRGWVNRVAAGLDHASEDN